jgi:hypothetical protein
MFTIRFLFIELKGLRSGQSDFGMDIALGGATS